MRKMTGKAEKKIGGSWRDVWNKSLTVAEDVCPAELKKRDQGRREEEEFPEDLVSDDVHISGEHFFIGIICYHLHAVPLFFLSLHTARCVTP